LSKLTKPRKRSDSGIGDIQSWDARKFAGGSTKHKLQCLNWRYRRAKRKRVKRARRCAGCLYIARKTSPKGMEEMANGGGTITVNIV